MMYLDMETSNGYYWKCCSIAKDSFLLRCYSIYIKDITAVIFG